MKSKAIICKMLNDEYVALPCKALYQAVVIIKPHICFGDFKRGLWLQSPLFFRFLRVLLTNTEALEDVGYDLLGDGSAVEGSDFGQSCFYV